MTNRYAGFTVILKDDYREDEWGEKLMNAIYCLEGVLSVEPVVSNFEMKMAEQRAKTELRKELYELLKDRH